MLKMNKSITERVITIYDAQKILKDRGEELRLIEEYNASCTSKTSSDIVALYQTNHTFTK